MLRLLWFTPYRESTRAIAKHVAKKRLQLQMWRELCNSTCVEGVQSTFWLRKSPWCDPAGAQLLLPQGSGKLHASSREALGGFLIFSSFVQLL